MAKLTNLIPRGGKAAIAGLVALISSSCEQGSSSGSDSQDKEVPVHQEAFIGGMMYSGDNAVHEFAADPDSTYHVKLNYSNDDFENRDYIVISANGKVIGQMHPPKDTGDWGYGWGNVVQSPAYTIGTGSNTVVVVDVTARVTDAYGFDLASVELDKVIPAADSAPAPK